MRTKHKLKFKSTGNGTIKIKFYGLLPFDPETVLIVSPVFVRANNIKSLT